MIICNNCGIGVEDSMRFCSECGAEILAGSRSSAPLRQPERDERKVAATLAQAPSPAAATTRLADANTEGEKPRERYTTSRAVVITIAIMLVVLFAGATVTWLISKAKDEPAPRSASETASLTKGASASAPSSTAVHGTPTASTPPTRSSRESEVMAALGGWVSSLEAHDLDTHMSYFAETLDTYYSHRSVGSARVRADLARAFSRYSTLSVRLSGIRVTFDRNDESASVTLDKTWTFANGPATAADKTWSGSVRQMVWLRRIDGRWRITGLKDI